MQVIDILEHNSPASLAALLLIVTAIAFSSCSDLSETQTLRVKEALDDTLLSSTESWNIDMELFEEREKKIRLRGSYAATFNLEDLNETRISGPVFVQVFDSAGTVETRVTSDSAIYRAAASEFELFGNVIVRTIEGRMLESEYLKWDQSKNRVSSPQFVIIITPRDSIAGNGFEGTTDLSEYTVREVTGQFIID